LSLNKSNTNRSFSRFKRRKKSNDTIQKKKKKKAIEMTDNFELSVSQKEDGNKKNE
jgi:BarA-like signal transduction histidine kinase